MLRPISSSCRRPGIILLVVLLFLTLMATVGLAFYFYADSSARAARYYSESAGQRQADVDPELLLAYFLRQFIYDVPDDASGVCSALRGHSLARNMYGCNFGPAPPATRQPAANIVPFNGSGRLHGPSPFGPEVDDYNLINYTYYADDPQLPPEQRFLRDPERLGWRAADLKAWRGPFAGGFNVPYTYPDLNATFLAAVRGDGAVLLPSFHRPWTAEAPSSGFTAADGAFFDPTTGQLNPLWSANPPSSPPWYKYTTLRPLPALNLGFPPPEDGGGDVKNLMGPGTLRVAPAGSPAQYWNNDSFWMDLDFPVLTAPDGRRYKPLFAPLIVDLDNRINANVHPHVHGPGQWLAPSNMEALLRFGDTGSPALTSELLPGQLRSLGSHTTCSFDLGRPGVSPWTHDLDVYSYQTSPTDDPHEPQAPWGQAIPTVLTTGSNKPPTDPRLPNGELGPIDWRAVSAALGRIDLSRPPCPLIRSRAAPASSNLSKLTWPASNLPMTSTGVCWRSRGCRRFGSTRILKRLLPSFW